MKALDLSKNNEVISYEKVASKTDGLILKIIRKDGNLDDKFLQHLEGSKKANIPIIGVYNYSYATTKDKAIYDATLVINYMKALDLRCAVWLDIEDSTLRYLGHRLIEIINAYKNIVFNAGFPFGLYTGQSFYNSYISPWASEIKDVPIWIARYYADDTLFQFNQDPDRSKIPSISNVVMWQYTSHGVIDGIKGYVDMNEVYYNPISSNAPADPEPVKEDPEIQILRHELESCKKELSEYKMILGNLIISLNHVVNELIQMKEDLENE